MEVKSNGMHAWTTAMTILAEFMAIQFWNSINQAVKAVELTAQPATRRSYVIDELIA